MAPPRPPPELIDDAVAEILLRLPPDEPAHLVRASLVCKPWRRILSSAAFLRRYRRFHGSPPLLGFFRGYYRFHHIPRFVPTTDASPFRQGVLDRRSYFPLDCRHGRVLLKKPNTESLTVWDPVTGHREEVREPGFLWFSAAVLCAVSGCDHRDCHGGPYLLLCMGSDSMARLTQACVYSSQAGSWGALISAHVGRDCVCPSRGTLVGDEIHIVLALRDKILKFNFVEHSLSVIDPPDLLCLQQIAIASSDKLITTDLVADLCFGYSILIEPAYELQENFAISVNFDPTPGDLGGCGRTRPRSRRSSPSSSPYRSLFPKPSHQRAMATPSQPPELTADLIGEIILRLQPDDPACLMRASLVCKLWRGIISDPTFPGRYRGFHRTPPLLGFFHNLYCGSSSVARFVSIVAAPPFPQPEPDSHGSWALDCRHGRVLLREMGSHKFAVWDPMTGHRRELHGPSISYSYMSYSAAAVLCGADGCDHLDCHGGPFLVVLVCPSYRAGVTRACVYSSKSGAWGAPASVDSGANYFDTYRKRGAVVRDEIYLIFEIGARILKYDMGKHCLSVIDPPDNYGEGTVLMPMEDGSLGFAGSRNYSIYLWSRKVDSDGVARWMQCRVIALEKLIPVSKSCSQALARVVGFAEGVGVVFVRNGGAGTFMIELKSERVRKVKSIAILHCLPLLEFPQYSRYIPAPLLDRNFSGYRFCMGFCTSAM
ncbi:hypothetical protein BAE44_0005542 [Dichanthelium oligosanthes]|uniref:F-box domain-containing protein n=1 Tax=Dichanthelium oligosanthes TaxID=888268 RepID=A0A1E5W861_9POAL|nr:hypothetical protein BAE44_0005542 [Dichanthelium oligosanthes]